MAKVNYSDMESKLIKLLRSGKKQTLSQLAESIYSGDYPGHPRSVVRNTIIRLAGKLKQNREGFAIWHDERQGPREVGYWAE